MVTRPRTGVSRRLALLISTLACFAALGATSALAGTIDYSADGSTVIVTGGDSASHVIQFRLSADAAHDEIIDTQDFTSIPGDCTVMTANTWIICPAHVNVDVELGSGNDTVSFDGQLFD